MFRAAEHVSVQADGTESAESCREMTDWCTARESSAAGTSAKGLGGIALDVQIRTELTDSDGSDEGEDGGFGKHDCSDISSRSNLARRFVATTPKQCAGCTKSFDASTRRDVKASRLT